MSTLTTEQEQLVVNNIGLAHYFARRYYAENMDHDDFVQVGMVGLVRAAQKFDASRGFKFSTLAAKCVKWEMLNTFRKKRIQSFSLNALVSNEEGYAERIELVADNSMDMNLVPLKMDLHQALSTLAEKERFIIKHSFGLGNHRILSQSQIAEILGFSQVHVGRLLRKALKKLRLELEGEIKEPITAATVKELKSNHLQKLL